jgi:hypothetical protein
MKSLKSYDRERFVCALGVVRCILDYNAEHLLAVYAYGDVGTDARVRLLLCAFEKA